jgi:hypothetical protein
MTPTNGPSGTTPRAALAALLALSCWVAPLEAQEAPPDAPPQDAPAPAAGLDDPWDAPRPAPSSITQRKVGSRRIVWFLQTDPLPDEASRAQAAKMPSTLLKMLGGSADKHFIAAKPSHLSDLLQQRSAELSPCLQGIEPCGSPLAVLLEGLEAQLLVKARLRQEGGAWRLEVRLLGADGRASVERRFTSPPIADAKAPEEALEALALETIRELFNSTGTLLVVTHPEGAQVALDGEVLGTSPLTTELPVGPHELRVTLDNHKPMTRPLEIAPGKRVEADLTLESLYATLTLDSTPVLGEVWVDGAPVGTAGSPIPLSPGDHEVEVRAEGYKPRMMRISVQSEENKVMSLTLEPKRQQLYLKGLGEIQTEAILSRHFQGRAAYRFASMTSTLANAEGSFGGSDVRLHSLARDGVGVPGLSTDLGFHGLNLELGYFWETWGVTALGLSVGSSSGRVAAKLQDGDRLLDVELDEFSRVELRPLQLMLRYPYKNLFPSLQAGLGYSSLSFQGTVQDGATEEVVNFEQGGFFWNFGIEASYFFDTWWFAHATLGIQRPITDDETRTVTFLGFGVGLALESPLRELGLSEDPTPPRNVEEPPREEPPPQEDAQPQEEPAEPQEEERP